MRKLTFVGAALLAVLTLSPRETAAASFSVNFCPGDATCPAGVTEASLEFTELGGNDYTVTAVISADNTNPLLLLEEIDITISGVQQDDYASITLESVNGDTTPTEWEPVFFGKVPACDSSGGENSFCVEHETGGVTQAGTTNTFVFTIDLADGVDALEAGDIVNLRANFDTGTGEGSILSPNGGPLGGTIGGGEAGVIGGGEAGVAPEPTLLAMLGAGLALAGRRLRRKASR